MRLFNCFLLLFVVFFIVSIDCQSDATFEGSWTDTCLNCFGGILYICSKQERINDPLYVETIEGVYSELGSIYADVYYTDENTLVAEGTWYESGYNDYTRGGFKLNMAVGGNRFEGVWWYDDQKCLKFDWNSNRISSDRPSASKECRALNTEPRVELAGVYRRVDQDNEDVDSFYLCTLSNDIGEFYTLSYDIGDTVGYSYGRTFQNQLAAQGSWFTDTTNGINSIWFTDDGDLQITFWEVDTIQDIGFTEYLITNSKKTTFELIKVDDTPATGLCLSRQSLANSDWDSVFTDTVFGQGRLYTCQDGPIVEGVYSEFGFIRGILDASKRNLRGTWVDSGARFEDHGTFQIELHPEFFYFEGTWTVDSIDSDPIQWTETVLDISDFYKSECYEVNKPQRRGQPRTDLNGQYLIGSGTNEVLDICLYDDNVVEGSYEYKGIKGFMTGYWQQDGQTFQAFWYEDDPTVGTEGEPDAKGIEFDRNTDGDVITRFYWSFKDAGSFFFVYCEDDDEINEDFYDTNKHFIRTYPRISDVTTVEQCTRNNYLHEVHNYDDDTYYYVDSSSTNLSLSLMFLLSVFFFLI